MVMSRKSPDPTRHGGLAEAVTAFKTVFEKKEDEKPFFPTLTKILLIIGLGFLSWLATYTGIIELIVANAGALDLTYRIAIAFAVAMLMLMIIYLLDALFSPIPWWLRGLYITGYLFLTLISVGFGFGFYWKFLESRSEATRSAESAVTQVQTSLQAGETRLEQLLSTLVTLTTLSNRKAEEERTVGRTCPNSPPGDGPRRRMRDADAKSFSFAGDFMRKRVKGVKEDIASLNGDLAKLASADKSTIDPRTGTRNVFLRGLSRKLDLTITRFNALRTDPQLKQFRDNFAKRAETTVFPNGRGGTFVCPDPQLQLALRGVVKAIDGLPDLSKPEVAAVEGSEAIVEAFRRLTTTLVGAISLELPPSPQELRALQQKAVRSAGGNNNVSPVLEQQAGLGQHDFIPLFIAIFVDICILLVSINRPVNKLQRLVSSAEQARHAGAHQILDRVHRVHDHGRSQRLDILHDVMFDSHGQQFVAVPRNVDPDIDPESLPTEKARALYDKKLMESRYLTTLMAALHAGGLVQLVPWSTQKNVQKHLRRLGSKFANSTIFRVYRFEPHAWSAIVLDDTMGAAVALDKELAAKRALAEFEQQGDEASPTLHAGQIPFAEDADRAQQNEQTNQQQSEDAARPSYFDGAPISGEAEQQNLAGEKSSSAIETTKDQVTSGLKKRLRRLRNGRESFDKNGFILISDEEDDHETTSDDPGQNIRPLDRQSVKNNKQIRKTDDDGDPQTNRASLMNRIEQAGRTSTPKNTPSAPGQDSDNKSLQPLPTPHGLKVKSVGKSRDQDKGLLKRLNSARHDIRADGLNQTIKTIFERFNRRGGPEDPA